MQESEERWVVRRSTYFFVLALLFASAFLEFTEASARSVGEFALMELRESASVCKAIAQNLEGQDDLLRELIDSTDLDERNSLLLEKANIDADLLLRYKRQSARQGVYLGNSFHGWPLSYYVKRSDGLFCGVGTRYLIEAEKAGPTQVSWVVRKIYLDAFYEYTSLPWWECCMDVSQEEFLGMVKEASVLYQKQPLKAAFRRWAIGIEKRTRRDLEAMMRKQKDYPAYSQEYRTQVQRDTAKFLKEFKRHVGG